MKRKNCKNKIMVFVVIMAMMLTCIQPVTAFAEETTIESGKAVYTDMGPISGYDSTNGYDYIWMGNYKDGTDDKDNMGSSLKWRVLDDQTNTGGDGYFLLACGTVDKIYFEKTGDPVDRGGYTEYIYSTYWAQSDARMWCQDFAGATSGSYKWGSTPSAFTALEQDVILPTSKSDSSYTATYKNNIGISYSEIFMEYNNILNNDKVFLPSAEEVFSEAYGIKGENVEIYTYLRSYPLPYEDNALEIGNIGYNILGYNAISVVNAFSDTFEGELSEKMQEYANFDSVTPAFNLAPDKALFTMAADNSGQADFGLAKDYAGSEWKLTLKDSNSFANGAAVSGETTLKPGDSLTVTHSALSSFNAGYTNVTAALIDESGNVYAYGSVNNDTAATSSTFAIPANCGNGTYTLMISGEDWNAAYNTNYATGTPFTATIKVSTQEDMSGTVNIDGTPEVGNTLTASVTGSNGGDTLAYSWYREGTESSIGTGSTYVLTADDYGKNITCKVSSPQCLGEISKTVGPVAQGTPEIGTVTANELFNTLNASQVILSRTDATVAGTLQLTDAELQYGTHDYNWKFTPDNAGYKTITGTVSVTVNDTIAPVAEYQVNDSQWKEFENFVTLGIFCKDTATMTVEATDSGTGVDTVKYYVSTSEVANPSAITEWAVYDSSIALNEKAANYVYVQVKDNAGNTAIYSEGVAVYTESAAVTTEAVEYTFKEGTDKEIEVELNGNTVKSIALQGQNTLAPSTDYTVDEGNSKITLKASYLDTLKASDAEYTFQIKYSPLGIDTAAVDMATTFDVKVSKAALTAADGDVTASGTYGAKLSELTVSGPAVTSNGNPVAGQWVMTGDTIPVVGDTGSYTATFVPDADAENYEALTKEVKLNIAKADVAYTAPAAKTGLKYEAETPQELITAGTAASGTMEYAIGTSSETAPENGWNTAIPTGTDAGTYYVWYKVEGGSNNNDIGPACITVDISKVDATSDMTSAEANVTYAPEGTSATVDLSTKLAEGYVLGSISVTDADGFAEDVIISGEPVVDLSDPANPTLKYTVAENAAAGRGVIISIPVTSSTNYNTYTIEVTVSISKSQQAIAFAEPAVTKTYGDASFTITANHTAGDGTVSYSSSDNTAAAVDPSTGEVTILKASNNPVTITATVGATKNYYDAAASYELTVSKKALTVKLKSYTVDANDEVPTFELEYEGLVPGESVTPAATPVFKVYKTDGEAETEIAADEAVKAAGTYTIKWENADSTAFIGSDNYAITKVTNSELKVNRKATGGYIPPTPPAPVTVPISGDENAIHVDASVDGTTAAIDKVDLGVLETVIGDDVKTGTVTIDFSGLDAAIETVEIPAAVVKEIADAAADHKNDADSLEIVFADGTSIEFDAAALGEKAAQAGGAEIAISILPSTKAKASDKQKEAIGDRPFYDISVMSGGKHISDMGGKITVHAPYELKPGEKAKGITVWYVDEDGKSERCETVYDSVKKCVSWHTDHLSVYMIGYDETAAEELTAAEVEALAAELTPVVRSVKTAKGNIKVTLKLDEADQDIIGQLKAEGFTVKYNFYRSEKKSAGYRSMLIKDGLTYTNTFGKKDNMYYYKARVQVYDQDGKLVARTELKDCRYANRRWTK